MKTLLAAIVGGLFVFLWGAVSHQVLPGVLGTGELGTAPDLATEQALQDALRKLPKSDVYLVPGVGFDDPAEVKAFEARKAAGPYAFLVYRSDGQAVDFGRQLALELAADVAAALLAAFVLSRTQCAYPTRVLLVTLMGAFAWLTVLGSYWNWYRFPDQFVLFEAVDQVAGWLLAGAMMAAMVKGKEG